MWTWAGSRDPKTNTKWKQAKGIARQIARAPWGHPSHSHLGLLLRELLDQRKGRFQKRQKLVWKLNERHSERCRKGGGTALSAKRAGFIGQEERTSLTTSPLCHPRNFSSKCNVHGAWNEKTITVSRKTENRRLFKLWLKKKKMKPLTERKRKNAVARRSPAKKISKTLPNQIKEDNPTFAKQSRLGAPGDSVS